MSYSPQEFKEKCASLASSVDEQAATIHTLALDALEQGNLHGNINKATWLLAALGRKGASDKVTSWLCAFGRFGTKKDTLTNKTTLVYQNKKLIDGTAFDAAFQQELASETPYYDYVKPKAASDKVVFDLEAELRKLLKHCAAIKEGKKDATLIHDEYEVLIKAMLPEGKAAITAQ
jgi:hypothetical protein